MDTAMRRAALEGAQQFVYFNTAAFLALVFTLIVSSLCLPIAREGNPAGRIPSGLRRTE